MKINTDLNTKITDSEHKISNLSSSVATAAFTTKVTDIEKKNADYQSCTKYRSSNDWE